MKLKGRWIIQLLVAILIVILGVFILVRQDLFKQVFIIALGIVAIVTGISSLATMHKYSFGRFTHATTLIKGVLGIIIGVLAVVMPLATGRDGVDHPHLCPRSTDGHLCCGHAHRCCRCPCRRVFRRPIGYGGIVSLVLAAVLFLFPRSVADLLVTIFGIYGHRVGLTVGLLAFWMRKKRCGCGCRIC